MLQPLTACGETRVSAEAGQFSRWGRGARLTRRVREEPPPGELARVYFDRNATMSGAKRRGSAGMDRRPNAAWVSPPAVKDSSRTRRDEPARELPTALFFRRQKPRTHDWGSRFPIVTRSLMLSLQSSSLSPSSRESEPTGSLDAAWQIRGISHLQTLGRWFQLL